MTLYVVLQLSSSGVVRRLLLQLWLLFVDVVLRIVGIVITIVMSQFVMVVVVAGGTCSRARNADIVVCQPAE